MARDTLIDRSIETAFRGVEEQVQALFVGEIKSQVERVKTEDRPSAYSQTIDGTKGAPIESVGAYGVASFTFSDMAEIVQFALAILQATSPVDSGDYRNSHHVYVDGLLVQINQIGMAATVVITSTLLYSRRIEVKRRNGKPWSKQPQVPLAGVYHAAAATLSRKYGNIVSASFGWVSQAADDPTQSPAGRFPAIIIDDRISLS